MRKIFKFIGSLYCFYVNILEKYLSHLLLLSMRIWIGLVFFRSGLTKFSNIEQATLLFEYEYMVPFIAPKLAAILATIFEIICGSFIIVGIFTRIVAIPLIIMSLVIQFYVYQNQEHFYWLFLLTSLCVFGSGKLSIEAIFTKFSSKRKNKK